MTSGNRTLLLYATLKIFGLLAFSALYDARINMNTTDKRFCSCLLTYYISYNIFVNPCTRINVVFMGNMYTLDGEPHPELTEPGRNMELL